MDECEKEGRSNFDSSSYQGESTTEVNQIAVQSFECLYKALNSFANLWIVVQSSQFSYKVWNCLTMLRMLAQSSKTILQAHNSFTKLWTV